MKKLFKVVHVKELFINNEGVAVFQVKLQHKDEMVDELGTSNTQETYYRKVTNPTVKEGQEVTIDPDKYDVVVENFEPDGEDRIIKLKYLYNKR